MDQTSPKPKNLPQTPLILEKTPTLQGAQTQNLTQQQKIGQNREDLERNLEDSGELRGGGEEI